MGLFTEHDELEEEIRLLKAENKQLKYIISIKDEIITELKSYLGKLGHGQLGEHK